MADVIRVAMVTRDYPPRVGGISTHAQALVEHLGRQAVEVEAFEGGGDISTLLLAARGKVNSPRFDILHVQSTPYGAFARKHPLLITAHSPVLEERAYYKGWNRRKAWFAYQLEQRALKKADAVIAVSQETTRLLRGSYGVSPRRLRLIPNGVDTDKFSPGMREVKPPKILICSRLDPRKNIREGIEALSKVRSPYRANVIGDGPERARLEDAAGALGVQVRFLGRVPEAELTKEFSTADIFLSTSLSEGFGLSLLQAMASGCCPVVSDIPAHRELVEHMKDGLVYAGLRELQDCLELLTRDENLCRRLGEAARGSSLNYSWDKVAAATAGLYRELLG